MFIEEQKILVIMEDIYLQILRENSLLVLEVQGEFSPIFQRFTLISNDFFWSELSWKCGSNVGAPLSCQNDIITRVFSFGEDQDKNLYILAGNVFLLFLTSNQNSLSIK
jgi:hypothetical protein